MDSETPDKLTGDIGQEIPRRSNFWFGTAKTLDKSHIQIFDQITISLCITLAVSSFMFFWPIISRISFEEAFFTPLAPFLMLGLSYFGIGANDAIRILFISSFMVSTVGIYILVRELTKRQIPAILASVIYLLPSVPVFVLTLFKRGLYKGEIESAKSFFTIVYGDGAHFLALAVMPFAILFFLRYVKRGESSNFVLSTLACVLILLANRTQALSLVLVLSIVGLSEFFLGQMRLKLKRLLLVEICSLGVVLFWYLPFFWAELPQAFSSQVFLSLKYLFPLPLLIAVLSIVFSFVFFGKREDRQGIFVSFLLFIIFLILCASWFVSHRSFVPHPQRIIANLNMFFAIVAGLTLVSVIDRLQLVRRFGFETWSVAAKVLGAIVFGVLSFFALAFFARWMSPYILEAVSGPSGIWIRIRMGVLADRGEALRLAGENFKLVRPEVPSFVTVFSWFLTLVFLVLVVFLSVSHFISESKEYSGE